jgi:hypothetical protein
MKAPTELSSATRLLTQAAGRKNARWAVVGVVIGATALVWVCAALLITLIWKGFGVGSVGLLGRCFTVWAVVATIAGLLFWIGRRVPGSPLAAARPVRRRLVRSTANTAAFAFYLATGPGSYWKYFFVLAAALEVKQLLSDAVSVVTASITLQSLLGGHRRGDPPRTLRPYVITIAAGGRVFDRLVPEVMKALWRYRATSSLRLDADGPLLADDRLSALAAQARRHKGWSLLRAFLGALPAFYAALFNKWFGSRLYLMFLDVDDLANQRESLRDYVITHAAAVIWTGTSRGGIGVALGWVSPEEVRNQGAALAGILGPLAGSAGQAVERQLGLELAVRRCLGPVLPVLTEKALVGEAAQSNGETVPHPGYIVINATEQGESLLPRIVEHMATCAAPIAAGDAVLAQDLRRVAVALASGGLAAVADAYLRYRVSHSDVERYIALLDCFDVLVRYSVLTLAGSGGQIASPEFREQLERPTLGSWVGLLRQGSAGSRQDSLSGSIRNFWQGGLAKVPEDLVDTARGVGLDYRGSVPRTHAEWLDWLVWLRNATKGHGATHEQLVAPLWMPLHESLLLAVRELSPLVLDAQITWLDERTPFTSAKPKPSLTGWRRGVARAGANNLDGAGGVWHSGAIICDGLTIDLAGYALVSGNRCITWNSRKGNAGEFIDWASGELLRVALLSPVAPA